MKYTLAALLVISGVLAAPQGAMAVFVFNPTLTMYEAHRSSAPSLVTAQVPAATDQTEARHPTENTGVDKVGVEKLAFPKFGMNE